MYSQILKFSSNKAYMHFNLYTHLYFSQFNQNHYPQFFLTLICSSWGKNTKIITVAMYFQIRYWFLQIITSNTPESIRIIVQALCIIKHAFILFTSNAHKDSLTVRVRSVASHFPLLGQFVSRSLSKLHFCNATQNTFLKEIRIKPTCSKSASVWGFSNSQSLLLVCVSL